MMCVMVCNEFNTGAFYKSKSGEMFFGGIRGLNYFYPADIADNPHPPPMAITRCKIISQSESRQDANAVFHKTIFENTALTLSHRDNIITFEFAALDFSAPEKNQYAYKMENFNKDWIHAGTARSATYSNLPPGDYTFRVKGSNNDGVWNETGASLKLTITPPWWRTPWAYMLYGLVIIVTIYFVRRYELNRLQLKNRLQIEHVEAEKLREVDQMKSRFFANISHEFRTPLTLILGQIDSVLGSIIEKENQSKLEVASRNARRLQRLINQLLDLSKLEAGSMALKTTRANLVSFLKNLVASFVHFAEQKHITLQFQSTHDEIALDYDPEKLEKVFYNLVSNAFKFTPEGGSVGVNVEIDSERNGEWENRGKGERGNRSVTVSTVHPLSNSPRHRFTGSCVLVAIKDTGLGISSEHLPHVFDRFYQADSSHQQEGTGIGLALAKELVELHHGEISVTSEVGKGTEFLVKLPLVSVASEQSPVISEEKGEEREAKGEEREVMIEDQASSIEHPATSIQKPATGTPEIVLLVEDNADIREYVREQLQSSYCVMMAADGEEGIAQAREAVPDLIITDVMMPNMDGYQMSRRLKQDEKTSHIPIIMLTAKAALDDKIAGLETGVDDYLLKPFSAKELLARVRNLISLRRQLRERFSTATIIKPSDVTATSVDQAFLLRVITAIEAHLSVEHFGVEELAGTVNMSSSQINRKLHGLIAQPASQLIRSMRLQRAADLLKQDAGTVAEIAYQVGFSDQAHFARSFKKQFGCAPSEFRRVLESGRG
jgi:signal transduction histidine kinase/DNA-binding response OmpR family regulator